MHVLTFRSISVKHANRDLVKVTMAGVYVYFASGRGEKYCDSVSVCLSVCPLANLKSHTYKFRQNFLHVLPVAVAPSCSDNNTIRHVLPVLCTTSCFHVVKRMGQNQRRCKCAVQFARWRRRERNLPYSTPSCVSFLFVHLLRGRGE